MDDDDYYPPDKVQIVVNTFKKNPKVDLVGSSEMLLYYTDNKKIYSLGPFNENHATNASMAWRKRYSNTHKYDEFVTKAEEVSFLDNYKHTMIQLDPKKTILVICHYDNTVDKNDIRNEHLERGNMKHFKETTYVLNDIVSQKSIISSSLKFSNNFIKEKITCVDI
jgi:hypothetical protein